MSGQDDKINCPRCGQWRGVEIRIVNWRVTDYYNREISRIEFTRCRCTLCKKVWMYEYKSGEETKTNLRHYTPANKNSERKEGEGE